MRTASFTSLLPSPAGSRRASNRTGGSRRQATVAASASEKSEGSMASHQSSTTTSAVKRGGGRDSLVADLFWTFHGDNATKYSDVTLIASDGRNFPCCRGILAARSDHFAKLLFDPNRRNPSNLRIDLPGNVLALIVQYLHTGDIGTEDSKDRQALDRLLDVTRAAHTMSHSILFTDCVDHILKIVSDNPAMLCPVFEAFFGDSSIVDGTPLLNALLRKVRKDPSAALLIPNLSSSTSTITNTDDLRPPVATGPGVGEVVGVLELSGRALQTLIAEDKKPENAGDDVHEEFWFYVVWYWAMHGPHSSTTPPSSSQDGTVDEANIKEMSLESITRRNHATVILDLLDARRMRAAFLLRVVEPTGLMSLQKLCEGYKSHATSSITNGDRKRTRLRPRLSSVKS